MKVQFYGVRGSYPVPASENFSTVKYGGNTTCVSISNELSDGTIDRLVIDCGTGAVQLGKDIVSNMFKGVEGKEVALCFTHLHPDHTQAYPFFAPNYIPGTKMYLIGMEALNKDVGRCLKM